MRSSIFTLCSSNGIHNIPLLSAVTEKRVSVPEAHKLYIYDVFDHTKD